MTLSVVSAPNPVLPRGRPRPVARRVSRPARARGCSTDSNAKNRPAMGAPKPGRCPPRSPRRPARAAATPTAPAAVCSPRSFAPAPCARAPRRLASEKAAGPRKKRRGFVEAPRDRGADLDAGPSGPSDAPAPRVTTAAAAFSAGRAAARAATVQDFGAAASDDASVCSADSDSCFVVFSEPHLGASSPSKPPARNRRPVTANPAAVGAATAPTACTHVSGRTSRMPSTRNRSGEYTVVVRNTRSCTPCSAMLNAPTPRPVSKPTPHATASKSVGLGSSGSSSRSRCRSFASFESSRSAVSRPRSGRRSRGSGRTGGGGGRSPLAARAGEASADERTRAAARGVTARRAHPPRGKTNATRHVLTGMGARTRTWMQPRTTRHARGASAHPRHVARTPGVRRGDQRPHASGLAVWRPRVAWCREAERPETRVES